jgi:hypothetical protein
MLVIFWCLAKFLIIKIAWKYLIKQLGGIIILVVTVVAPLYT